MAQSACQMQIPLLAAGLRRVFGRYQRVRGVPRLLWWSCRWAFPRQPITANTPDGLPITISPSDYGQAMMFFFPYCPELRTLLTDTVHLGDLCFDLGANVGLLTAVMAQLVGSEGKVIAVEPNPMVAAQLSHTVNLCFPDRVSVVRAGVTGEEGTGALLMSRFSESVEVSSTEQGALHAVRLVTIDSLVHEFGIPDFIKVDIEGEEAQLLRSMAGLLATGARPTLLIEFHPEKILRRKGDIDLIRHKLREIGYNEWPIERVGSAYRLHSEPPRPLGHENVLFVKPMGSAKRSSPPLGLY